MAGEIQVPHGRTARTLYALVRDAGGRVWDGAGFVAYAGGGYADYVVPLAEQGDSGYYAGSFPPGPAAGGYQVEVRDRVGAAPAETDPVVGAGTVEWSGAEVVPLATLVDALLDTPVEGGITLRQAVRFYLAVLSGNVATGYQTPGGTATATFLAAGGTRPRIVARIDGAGNRTIIARDGT